MERWSEMKKYTQQELMVKIELVVGKLMNLDRPLDEEELMKAGGEAIGMFPRDFGITEWDWPQGVGLYGLNKLDDHFKDGRYVKFLDEWFENNIENGLPSRNINTTAPLLTLVEMLDKLDNPKYEALCHSWAEWLMACIPRTREGGFQHVTSANGDRQAVRLNESELWIDTLFMTVLFLNKMGHRTGNKSYISEAIHQCLIHIKYLYEKKSGLFYHGWSFNEKSNFGEVFWCRGNSWFTYGIMIFIESFQGTLDPGVKKILIDTYKAQTKALKNLQSKSGLWHTVLDDPSSYEEVSGSAAIAAGMLQGVKMGVLDDEYRFCAEKAIGSILKNIDHDGTVLNVSGGTGMGDNREHYKNIIIAPMAYGQSLTILALTQAL